MRKADRYSRAHSDAYDAAYLLGYFSDCEWHEVPGVYRDDVDEAVRKFGSKMTRVGIAAPFTERSR